MISDVRKQIQAGERPGVAFILSPADQSGVAAAVCGFLNARGGIVFVGVQDDGEVIGVGQDTEGARRDLEVALQTAISPKALFTVSVDADVIDGRSVISIEAPAGRDTPYVVDGRVWVRSGRRTVMATPDLLRELVQGRSVEADRWERRPSVGLSDTDLDREEILRTIEEARSSSRLEFDSREITPALRQLGLVSSGGLTNACDVVFARRPAQRHPQCRVRFVRFETDKAGSEFVDSQWFEGPLVQVFYDLIEKIGAQVRVRALFAPGEVAREDRPNYSLEALREGLVNALAHRDYAGFSGGLTVSVYPNRVEIWNSGRLPRGIAIGDLKKLHPSIPTNPDVSHVLYLRRLMERIGRGTQKIVQACEELGARSPKWRDDESGVTLTIFSATSTESFGLNPRQAQLMEQLRPGDTLSARDYVMQQKVSERQARRDLGELEDAGFLSRSGRARATLYQRTERTI